MKTLGIVDLFCGAGGLTSGFEKLSKYPYKSLWANDFNSLAALTYNENFGKVCVPGDIVDILENPTTKLPQTDLVIGGPPCQGFSLLNKKRSDDPRKKLWIPYMQTIDRTGARVFVMENVPQLLDSLEFGEILEWAERRGFRVWHKVLNAADYGVAQTRKRAFIVGSRDTDPNSDFPPKKTNYDPTKYTFESAANDPSFVENPKPWATVRDRIADLPEPVGTEITALLPPKNLHFGRTPTAKSLARYHAIPKEGMNRFDLQRVAPELTPECWIRKTSGGTDLFGRLWWNRPSVTIRTEFFKPEKGRYLHPEQHRPITHREAARIQSFEDSFVFVGSKIEVAKQIGNAVPPLLAAAVADRVYEMVIASQKLQDLTSSST